MKYDITDKLKFDADPVIKVRDMEITTPCGTRFHRS